MLNCLKRGFGFSEKEGALAGARFLMKQFFGAKSRFLPQTLPKNAPEFAILVELPQEIVVRFPHSVITSLK